MTPPDGTPPPPTWRERAREWWRAHGPLMRAAAPTWFLIVLASAVVGLSVRVCELELWISRHRTTPGTVRADVRDGSVSVRALESTGEP